MPLTTNLYYPSPNGQVKQYSMTVTFWLHNYRAEHQCDLEIFGQLFTYAHKTQINLSSGEHC